MRDVGEVPADEQIASQLERVIRRVKRSMNYHGSYSTRDILGSLVARWVQSGEWERLKELPPEERHLGQSVRRFILDRLDQLRRRGGREELDGELELPDEQTLVELVELAELRQWIVARVEGLCAGEVDPRVKIGLSDPQLIGRALELHLEGKTQREIAAATGMSLGVVNKRIAEGTSYLAVLSALEGGG
jgi:hypothetical protein